MEREQITELLENVRTGNQDAEAALISALYDDMRRLAALQLRGERPDHTLRPTALVHEVYIHLRRHRDKNWQNRAHYLGAVVNAMRRILVDHAREKAAKKRGSRAVKVPIDDVMTTIDQRPEDLLDIDRALRRLAAFAPFESRVTELRYIGGLTIEEAAEVLAVSPKTVDRAWSRAKAWLASELADDARSVEASK